MSAPAATAVHDVELADGRLSVRVRSAGTGPDLLYLHPESGLAWDPFVRHLATTHTMHAPEFPGTTDGDPHAIHAVHSWADLVLLYEELTRRLGLDRPVLVGPSFGGMLAADLAATFPALPDKVVLLAPVGLWRKDRPVLNWNAVARDRLPGLLYHNLTAEPVRAALRPPDDPDAVRAAIAALVWALGCTGRFTWPIPDQRLADRLHRLAAPTLLVWGKQDRVVDVSYAEDFASAARATVVTLEECGHFPQVEQLDRTVAAVDKFLAG